MSAGVDRAEVARDVVRPGVMVVCGACGGKSPSEAYRPVLRGTVVADWGDCRWCRARTRAHQRVWSQ